MRFAFADVILDPDRRVLMREGAPVAVEPQVFDLLECLAGNAGRVVGKDALIETVWGGRIVSDATISARINAARKAVGDNGKDQRIIRTVQRRGFELRVPVSIEGKDAPAPPGGGPGAMRQTIRYATSADGTGIAYAESGDGPALLRAGHFLTHLELDWQDTVFTPYIHALSRAFRLVRYDMRGVGLSQVKTEALSIEAYCDDMRAVADAAGLERFPIFAISQGVPVAVEFAARHPERVSRMVLYGGFAQGRMRREEGEDAEEARALLTMIRAGWGKSGSAFMQAFTSVFCPDASRGERESLVKTQLASATPEMALRLRRALDAFDVTEHLAHVRAPTLVIHADGDGVNPLSQARLLASSIPGAEIRVVRSNSHIFLETSPVWDEIMSATQRFLMADRGTGAPDDPFQ